LDRNSWGDVHDVAVTFTLTTPIGPLDMLAGHLTGHWRFATDRDSSAVARHAISADMVGNLGHQSGVVARAGTGDLRGDGRSPDVRNVWLDQVPGALWRPGPGRAGVVAALAACVR
jgi:hypothetical protein